MGKNRKFIDKRYDTIHTFKVVQRSQKDPLVADEAAPQGVLVDTECSDEHKEDLHRYGVYFDDEYDYLQHLRGAQEGIDWENCDLEVYTIRNKDPKRAQNSEHDGLILPSSAFESYVEEPIGLLNKAAPVTGPQLELDPDIVAELDSDGEGSYFDPEDEDGLPDDFVTLLKGDEDAGEEEEEEDEEGEENYIGIQQWLGGTSQYYGQSDKSHLEETEYEDMPPLEESVEDIDESYTCENAKILQHNEEKEEEEEEHDEVANLPIISRKRKAKTNSTSRKSSSSSTLPRTELLRTFDAKFERMYKEEFSEDQFGALDGETIEGPLSFDSPQFLQALETTKKQFTKPTLDSIETEDKKEAVQWLKNVLKLRNDMQGEKEEFVEIEMEPKLKYDLESYLALRTQARARRRPNRPHIIDHRDIKTSTLTKKALKEHNHVHQDEEETSSTDEPESEEGRLTLKSQISLFSQRPKDETPNERRDRKKALKELRKVRREEKKLSKLCFKEIKKSEGAKRKNKGNVRVIPLTGLV